MDNEFYKDILKKSPIAYAYHKIILNENGVPIDFEFIDINSAYEKLTGLKADIVNGKTILQLVPDIKKDKFDWIGECAKIALNGGMCEFRQYSFTLNKWFKVTISFHKEYYFIVYFNDISEEISTIEELDNFFNVNVDLLCIANMEGKLIKVNKVWEQVLGYSALELQGSNFFEYIHPDDIDQTKSRLENLMIKGEVLNFMNRYKSKDNTYKYLEWHARYSNELIYASAKDITDKIDSQKELAEKEENFRNFFETMDDLIFVANPDGKVIFTNNAVTKKLGYMEDELKNMTIRQFHPQIYREEADKIFAEMFRQEREFCPLPLLRADGGLIPVETRAWFGKWNRHECLYGISKDLTLQQSALDKFQKLFDSNPAIMAVSTIKDRKFIDVNNTFINKLGYTKEDVVGKTSEQLNLFEKVDKQESIASKLKNEGEVRGVELKVRKKDGSTLDGLFYGEIIDNQGEKVFLTVMLDITNQRESEKEAIKAKIRMTAILDNLPYIAWLKDTQGRYIAVNKPFCEICGKPVEEIINKFENEIWPEEAAIINQRKDREVILSGRKKYYEEQVNIFNTKAWVEIFITPIFDEDGTIIGTTGIARDITTKKTMEIELKKQKEFLNQVINAIPDLLFYKDKLGVYLGCNKAFSKICLGLEESDVIGKTDYDFFEDKSKANYFRKIDKKVITSCKSNINEEAIRFANGQIVELETIKIPFYDEKDNPIGIIGIARDITERKRQANELFAAKQAAESANLMKGQFLANMSHEIRTPLNGIIGFLEMLGRTKLSKEQLLYITDALAASEVLLYLINDILDFSKIDAGKLVMENIVYNLANVINDSISILSQRAEEKNIEINLYLNSNIPEEIEGDPSRLRQVLNNLLGNAIKFTNSGEVNITVEKIEEYNNESVISFEIQDTGVGMSDEVKSKLFEPFVQGDSSTTRKYGGTGLGLVITKELISLMDGTIDVESTLGIGSTFSFTIKARNANKNVNDKKYYNKLKGINILIVDDNKANIKIMKAYLEEFECKVFETHNFNEALTLIITNNKTADEIQIAIIQSEIPNTNGFQLATTLKTMPLSSDIKLILLNTTHESFDSLLIRESGFVGSLRKPIKKDELANELLSVLDCNNDNFCFLRTLVKNNSISNIKILLVEDNDINRKVFIAMLKERNLECDISLNGKEAIEAIKSNEYDIVFMDCHMPIMDGYEATRIIRQLDSDKKNVYIVAMTANAMEGDKEKCILSGMDDYISKPIDSKKMFRMIEEREKLLNKNLELTY